MGGDGMDEQKPKVQVIPANPFKRYKKEDDVNNGSVGIYCRVSTTEQKQLNSLSNQVSGLLKYLKEEGMLYRFQDAYIDIYSGTSEDRRPEFNRMLGDVKAGKIKTVVTKSIQRFGRNTTTVINAIETIRGAGGRVIFVIEKLDTLTRGNDFIISVLEGVAQEESQAKSDNIRWGIQKSLMDKDSRYYNRVCYGYFINKEGKMAIHPFKADVVKDIFNYYSRGFSISAIKRALEFRRIPSPTGKDKWAQKTIQNILTNEKYKGDVEVLKTKKTSIFGKRVSAGEGDKTYKNIKHHPAIIFPVVFDTVQDMMKERSNIEIGPDGKKRRKKTHYSSLRLYKELIKQFGKK